MSGELEEGKTRIINLEIQLANLTKEKERTEEELRTTSESGMKSVADLEEKTHQYP